MNRNKAPRDREELFQRIRKLSDEAEWSADELREALIEEGIDPDQLVKEVKIKIQGLSNVSPPFLSEKQPGYGSLPLLPRLRQITGLKATAIAEKMGMSVTFLSDLSNYPSVIPFRARKELARRATQNLPGVSERDVLDSFNFGSYQQAAAYRDAPFPEEEVSFEKVVLRSDMSEEQKQYWLGLTQVE